MKHVGAIKAKWKYEIIPRMKISFLQIRIV